MNRELWTLMVKVKTAERYYWHYIRLSTRHNSLTTGLCLLVAAASIAAWYIGEKASALWAAGIIAAQIVSRCETLLPFSRRISAATYAQKAMNTLFINLESEWEVYSERVPDGHISRLCAEYSKRFQEIEGRFAPPGLFPQNAKLRDLAQNEAQTYFFFHYDYPSH